MLGALYTFSKYIDGTLSLANEEKEVTKLEEAIIIGLSCIGWIWLPLIIKKEN